MNWNILFCSLFILIVPKINAQNFYPQNKSSNQVIRSEDSYGFKIPIDTPALSNDVNRCPQGWIFEGNACFYFNTDYSKMNLTWVSAQGECDGVGGYLAEPATELEQEFLYSSITIIEGTGQRSNWWIGLSDISHEGNWYWQYKETALDFTSWKIGRPNTESSNLDDCALMYSNDESYDWLDVNCETPDSSVPTSFVCQKMNDYIPTSSDSPTADTTFQTSTEYTSNPTSTAYTTSDAGSVGLDYIYRQDFHCSGHQIVGGFWFLADAMEACDDDSSCSCINDTYCDGSFALYTGTSYPSNYDCAWDK